MVHLKLTGMENLAKGLRALDQDLRRDVLIDALKEAAEPMRASMAALAPRGPDAPHLANSMSISVANKVGGTSGGRWLGATTDNEASVAVGPSKDFFYGLFLEYGTVKMSARPFMRPAFDENAQASLEILKRALWAAISSSPTGGSGGSL